MSVNNNDLSPWNDPEDLLAALVRIPRDQLEAMKGQLRSLLLHDDADVREQAARRLLVHLKANEYHADALQLLSDPAPGVRRAAAFAITSTSTAGTKMSDAAALIKTLRNERESDEVRRAAYESLLLLFDRKDALPLPRSIDFEHDIDWTWIGNVDSESSRQN